MRKHITIVLPFVFCLSAFPLRAQEIVNSVSVLINTVHNKGCWDRIGAICTKPDMMAQVAFRLADGRMIPCGSTTPIPNFDNIGPDPTRLRACSSIPVQSPFSLVISLYDVDERQLAAGFLVTQERIWLSFTPPGDLVVPFAGLSSGVPTSVMGPDADIDYTITITPAPPVFTSPMLTLSSGTFFPQLGEAVVVQNEIKASGTTFLYPTKTFVTLSVKQGTGPATTLSTAASDSQFQRSWDGRLAGGLLAPPGTYTLEARLDNGGNVSAADVVVGTTAPAITIFDATNAQPWNPRAGSLVFPFRATSAAVVTARIEGPSPNGRACTVGALSIAVPDKVTSVAAGSGQLQVEMLNGSSRFIVPGNYCVRFASKSPTGVSLGSVDKEIDLADPSDLRLVVTLDPAVPALFAAVPLAPGSRILVPSMPITVQARALDKQGRPRPTGAITVRAMPLVVPPGASFLVSSTTCHATDVCRVSVSSTTLAATGSTLGTSGVLAFDASASDLSGPFIGDIGATATFGPRGAELTSMTANAVMVNVPLTSSGTPGTLTLLPRNQTLDVAFHFAVGIDITQSGRAAQLGEVIGQVIDLVFGGDRNVGETSLTSPHDGSPSRIAFWFATQTAVVRPYGLCQRSYVPGADFAEMHAVIHAENCRDSADSGGATFSASLVTRAPVANIFWHEFHHAAYDLADEYPPDGGYFQTSDYPNVFRDATQCALYGAYAALQPPEPQCEQIGTTGWWRDAPRPDVMIDLTVENRDELRRANLILTRCKGGGC